ncbi:MAG: hypothetical protein LLG06_17995 [Desulfobacteraceae bacterium]|nr:hypothetical protein [Desulfobacteraceae bacterium]
MKASMLIKAVVVGLLLALTACGGMAPAMQTNHRSDRTVDSAMPAFENRLETDHFVLRWTNKSSHSGDNIADQQIIQDTASYLETAWEKYAALFGRNPYIPPGKDKIEVVFREMDCYGVADPPDGPIQLNSYAWVRDKGIRQPTSAHELFHKMQYAYGYKVDWVPRRPYMWLIEGTAAWGEVYVWGRVSRTCKVDEMFRDTKLDIYDADDMAMPFWIYFVQGNKENPNHALMVELLETLERRKDEKKALDEVIQAHYGSVESFFASFSQARKQGFWAECCRAPYNCILGPDGKDIVEKVKGLNKKG